MTVTRLNTEIRDQAHEMWAEGCGDVDPLRSDIIKLLEDEGFEAKNIDIWFDRMQYLYRWTCTIERLKTF